MNSIRNKVQLIGNLGNDPEMVELENGKKLTKFSIATNETYKNQEGEKITKPNGTELSHGIKLLRLQRIP